MMSSFEFLEKTEERLLALRNRREQLEAKSLQFQTYKSNYYGASFANELRHSRNGSAFHHSPLEKENHTTNSRYNYVNSISKTSIIKLSKNLSVDADFQQNYKWKTMESTLQELRYKRSLLENSTSTRFRLLSGHCCNDSIQKKNQNLISNPKPSDQTMLVNNIIDTDSEDNETFQICPVLPNETDNFNDYDNIVVRDINNPNELNIIDHSPVLLTRISSDFPEPSHNADESFDFQPLKEQVENFDFKLNNSNDDEIPKFSDRDSDHVLMSSLTSLKVVSANMEEQKNDNLSYLVYLLNTENLIELFSSSLRIIETESIHVLDDYAHCMSLYSNFRIEMVEEVPNLSLDVAFSICMIILTEYSFVILPEQVFDSLFCKERMYLLSQIDAYIIEKIWDLFVIHLQTISKNIENNDDLLWFFSDVLMFKIPILKKRSNHDRVFNVLQLILQNDRLPDAIDDNRSSSVASTVESIDLQSTSMTNELSSSIAVSDALTNISYPVNSISSKKFSKMSGFKGIKKIFSLLKPWSRKTYKSTNEVTKPNNNPVNVSSINIEDSKGNVTTLDTILQSTAVRTISDSESQIPTTFLIVQSNEVTSDESKEIFQEPVIERSISKSLNIESKHVEDVIIKNHNVSSISATMKIRNRFIDDEDDEDDDDDEIFIKPTIKDLDDENYLKSGYSEVDEFYF